MPAKRWAIPEFSSQPLSNLIVFHVGPECWLSLPVSTSINSHRSKTWRSLSWEVPRETPIWKTLHGGIHAGVHSDTRELTEYLSSICILVCKHPPLRPRSDSLPWSLIVSRIGVLLTPSSQRNWTPSTELPNPSSVCGPVNLHPHCLP